MPRLIRFIPCAHRATPWLLLALLAACATPPGVDLPPPLLNAADARRGESAPGSSTLGAATGVERMPAPPRNPAPEVRPAPEPSRPPPKSPTASLNFEQVPLTTAIQVVYADILGRTLQIDPKVMERRDLVTPAHARRRSR